MAALTKDKQLAMTQGEILELAVGAAKKIFSGACVGLDPTTRLAQPFADGDVFAGFAERPAHNSLGAASAIKARVRGRGIVTLTVAGTDSANDIGKVVYATTDNDFSITDSGTDTAIGVVAGWESGTTCLVSYKSALLA